MTFDLLETTVEEYWDWFMVALFVLVTVDMITTMYAAWSVGFVFEANPLMRWALVEGIPTVIAVNIVATIVSSVGFYLLMQVFEQSTAPYDRVWAFGIQAWLGLMIAIGLFVFANNLNVIVHGRSLILLA